MEVTHPLIAPGVCNYEDGWLGCGKEEYTPVTVVKEFRCFLTLDQGQLYTLDGEAFCCNWNYKAKYTYPCEIDCFLTLDSGQLFCIDFGEFCAGELILPTISIIGWTETIQQGEIYIDKGATAVGTEGDITHLIQAVSNVNSAIPGNYSVIYTVRDCHGQEASRSRAVKVAAD